MGTGGTFSRNLWRPAHADGALRNGEDESPPAARPAQNGTRRPPKRRRAAETANVNVGCWVGAVRSWKARHKTVAWSAIGKEVLASATAEASTSVTCRMRSGCAWWS